MEAELIREAITPKTRAVLVVHIYGQPVDMLCCVRAGCGTRSGAGRRSLRSPWVIFQGKPCGSFGVISVTSTYANKAVTTGEGGVCLTDDPELADRLEEHPQLVFRDSRSFHSHRPRIQLQNDKSSGRSGRRTKRRFEDIVDRKIQIGEAYSEALKPLEVSRQLQLPAQLPDRVNSYWMYGCVLSGKVPADAENGAQSHSLKGVSILVRSLPPSTDSNRSRTCQDKVQIVSRWWFHPVTAAFTCRPELVWRTT